MTDTRIRATLSALPLTNAGLAAWDALTRDEQVARYREYLSHPDCQRVGTALMADVLAEARERVAIYDATETRFGRYQADAYFAGLERTFGLLADFPGIG
jgi:hypothetical protein